MRVMSPAALLCAAALAALAPALACVYGDAVSDGGCGEDNACEAGLVCAFGACVDPSDQRLTTVDIEVDPPGEALPVQGVFGVDLRERPRVEVILAAGVLVSGALRDSAGAAVDAFVLAQPPQSVPGRVLAPSSTTEQGGVFRFLAVEGLRYAMTVSPTAARLPPSYGIRLDAEADEGALQSLEPLLVAEGAVVMSGIVVAGAGAALSGIPDLDVVVKDKQGRRLSTRVRTGRGSKDTLGHFELFLHEGGEGFTLEIAPTIDNAGYPTVLVPLDIIDTSDTIDVGTISLDTSDSAFPVLTPVPLSARVVDVDGNPVPGAVLSVSAPLGAGQFAALLQADAFGDLEGALPPAHYQAIVYAPPANGLAGLVVVAELDVPSSNANLTFTLPRRVPYRGTVRDRDGAPLAGATLTISRVGDGEREPEPLLADVLLSFSSTSDASGQFQVAVDPGAYRVSTRPPRGSDAPAFSQLVVVRPAGLRRDVQLPGRALVAGSVVFAGAPVGAAFIRVFSGFVDERGAAILVGEGFADDSGAFEIAVPDIVASVANPTPPLAPR